MSISFPQPPSVIKELSAQAAEYKREGNMESAINSLKKMYEEITKTTTDYGVDTFLRLPMYLQKVGKVKDAWVELNKLLERGYPNQATDPGIITHNRADIYYKMWVFLEREEKWGYAIVYAIFFFLSRAIAFHLQYRKEESEYIISHRPHDETLAKLLRKLDKEALLEKIRSKVENALNNIPDVNFSKVKKEILSLLYPNSPCTLVLEDRKILRRPKSPPRVSIKKNGQEKPLGSRDSITSTVARKKFVVNGVTYKFKRSRSVPKWNDYYPNLGEASPSQKRFYKRWVNNYRRKVILDVDGNLSYIFVYIYSAIKEFEQNNEIADLTHEFKIIETAYPQYEKIRDYLHFWIYRAYLYIGEYDKAWDYARTVWRFGTGEFKGINRIINIRAKCRDTSIDGKDVLIALGHDHGLTAFGQKNHLKIIDLVTIILDNSHKEYRKNYVEHFVRQYNFSNLTERDFEKLKEYYSKEKDFLFWKESYKREGSNYYPYFYHAQYLNKSVQEEAIPYVVSIAAQNAIKSILRECENTLREEKNLPKVGEGWISETELFYKLCKAFPEEVIVHHGRPSWLDPQHLDIYFPKKNLSIEYQGAQHDNPVDYFGGEKAFKEQQKRDKRKAKLCEKNGCILLYVRDGYKFEDVRAQIKKLCENNSL